MLPLSALPTTAPIFSPVPVTLPLDIIRFLIVAFSVTPKSPKLSLPSILRSKIENSTPSIPLAKPSNLPVKAAVSVPIEVKDSSLVLVASIPLCKA